MNKYLKVTLILLFFSVFILNSVNANDLNMSDTLQAADDFDDALVEVSSSDADNLVELTSEEEDILSAGPKTFTDLQNIIDSADEGSVIELTDDYKHVSGETANYIYITKSLTVNGNGHTIDGNNIGYNCYITGNNVVLNNITFINANVGSGGGGVYWTGNNGILSNSKLEDNSGNYGSALLMSGNNGKIINTTFVNNVAEGSYGLGAAVYAASSNTQIINSTFENNTGVNGGAVYLYGNGDIVDNSTFKGNKASGSGGAIYWYGSGGDLTGSTFTDNSANSFGGAVYYYVTGGNIDNNTFEKNSGMLGGALSVSADNVVVSDSKFNDNSYFSGSSLYVNGNNVKLLDSTIENDDGSVYAVQWMGSNGVVDNISVSDVNVQEVISWNGANGKISNSNFTNNTASSAIVNWNSDDGTLSGLTFKDNYCGSLGSILLSGNNNQVSDSVFDNNSALGGSALSVKGINNIISNISVSNSDNELSGAVNLEGTNNVVKNSRFENNTGNTGASINIRSDGNSVTNSSFKNDSANNGGSIYVNGKAQLDDITITDDTANQGGAIYINADSKLNNINVSNSNATDGGAIYIANGDFKLTNSVFTNNSADNYGGSIYSNPSNSVFDNITVSDSSAVRGGGVYVFNQNSTLANSKFTNNSAGDTGGGVYWASNGGTIKNTSVSSCTAEYEAGAIFVDREDVKIINSTVSNSSSLLGGGILWSASNGYIINSTIANNTADDGAGVLWIGQKGHISNSVIANNSATYSGGGVLHSLRDIEETNNIFYNNTPDDDLLQLVYITSSRQITFNLSNGAVAFCLNRSAASPPIGVAYFKLHDSLIHDRLGHEIWEDLKTLYWNYYFEMDFAEFDQILQRMLLNDTGFPSEPRVPNTNAVKILSNGTAVLMNFTLMYPVRGNFQPLMVLDYEVYTNPEIEIIKLANNKSADLGDVVSFTIVVNNTGDCNLTGVVVREIAPDGLTYLYYEGVNWTKDSDNFEYLGVLGVNDTASFTVYFNATKVGNFTNVVVVSTNVTEDKTANNTTHINKPNLTVEKISLNKTVELGQFAEFEIVVRNTGEADLKNVWVSENNFTDGLNYIKFISKDGNWEYDETSHIFKLLDILKVGHSKSFVVIFNTTSTGLKTNTVKAGNENTTFSNSTNTTEVINKTPENETSEDNETEGDNSTEDKIPDEIPSDGNRSTVDNPPVIDEKVADEEVSADRESHESTFKSKVVDAKATGNPIFLILLALISLAVSNFKRKF